MQESQDDKTIVGEKLKIEVKKNHGDLQKSKGGVVFASLVLLVGIGFSATYFWSNSDQSEAIKEAKTETPGINNSDRSISSKPVKKVIKRKPASTIKRKKPKRVQPKRYIPKPRRVERRVEVYNEPEEPLDINDPDVQEELTRSLAGDLDENPYPDDRDLRYDDEAQDDLPPEQPIDDYQDYPNEEPEVYQDDGYYDEPPPEDDYGYDAPYNE